MKLKKKTFYIFLRTVIMCFLFVFSSIMGGIQEKAPSLSYVLHTIPQEKATVGILLLYTFRGHPYVLLARERADGSPEKAGTFSDFGGSTQKGTFLDNIIRELKEESAGLFNFSSPLQQRRIIEKSIMLEKSNPKTKRKIIYLIYPIESTEFKPASLLNKIRQNLSYNPKIPSSYLEKDRYIWADLKDLCRVSLRKEGLKGKVVINTLNEGAVSISLRRFFIEDCLYHRVFQNVCRSYGYFK